MISIKIIKHFIWHKRFYILEVKGMPEICRFFGIIIRMFYSEHNPPHFHIEFGGQMAVFDLMGNILKGDLKSKTATKLVREWIDIHSRELEENWNLSRAGQPFKEIAPLD
jgi:hypothetical protein